MEKNQQADDDDNDVHQIYLYTLLQALQSSSIFPECFDEKHQSNIKVNLKMSLVVLSLLSVSQDSPHQCHGLPTSRPLALGCVSWCHFNLWCCGFDDSNEKDFDVHWPSFCTALFHRVVYQEYKEDKRDNVFIVTFQIHLLWTKWASRKDVRNKSSSSLSKYTGILTVLLLCYTTMGWCETKYWEFIVSDL